MAAKGPKTDLLEVLDLTGGIDRRSSPTLLKPNRSRQNSNVRLSVAGRWSPRPGFATFSTSSLGAGRIQGGTRCYLTTLDPDAAPFTVMAFDGSIYRPTDGGVWGSPVYTGISSTNAVDFPADATMVAAFDASNVPVRSVDGTSWVTLGVFAPTVAPVLTGLTSGTLTTSHTYEVAYTYEGDLNAFESNEGSTTTLAIGTTNQTIRVTVTGTTDPQVVNIDVYARDVTAGESTRRFAGTVVNPGTTGTTTVTLTSNVWSSADPAPTTHDTPPPFKAGVVWKNRWWAFGPDVLGGAGVQFSELFLAQSWPASYVFAVPFTKGDRVAALIPLGDVLVILGKGAQGFLVFAQTALDFDIRPAVNIGAGAFGFRAWALVEAGAVHAGAEGTYIFDGSSDKLLTNDLDADYREMARQSDADDLDRVALVHHRRDKELRLALPFMSDTGSPGEYVMDLARTQVENAAVWSMTDRPIGGYMAWDGPEPVADDRGRLFSWSLATGELVEESTGQAADGSDLISQYLGPILTTHFYMNRFSHCVGEFRPADGSLNITVDVDGIQVTSKTIDIGSGLSLYGTATYGTSQYGGKSREMWTFPLPTMANGRGVSISATYTGQADPPFELYDYGLLKEQEPEIRGIVG